MHNRHKFLEKKRNLKTHSSASSVPVGCPGFCWLIDSIWPFVVLWKSIQTENNSSSFFFVVRLNLFRCFFVKTQDKLNTRDMREQFVIVEKSFSFVDWIGEAEIFVCLPSSGTSHGDVSFHTWFSRTSWIILFAKMCRRESVCGLEILRRRRCEIESLSAVK